jgi:hypothetical protein
MVGAAVVSLNYIIQTTFVPAVVAHYTEQHAVILETFSMVNPHHLPGRPKCGDMDSSDLPHGLPPHFLGIIGMKRRQKSFHIEWGFKYCRSAGYRS